VTGVYVPGEFTSHSGRRLPFKIEADHYTEREMDLFGELIVTRLWGKHHIERVIGMPKSRPGGRDNGGILAQYVRRHLTPRAGGWTLIVDDVLTTGNSMEAMRRKAEAAGHFCIGAVIDARGLLPPWIRAIQTLDERLW
jgi:hypothetical protein